MPSLTSYYRALGHALDDLLLVTAQSGTSTTVVLPSLVSGASNASANRYDGHWIYNATVPATRLARTGGYTPSTGTIIVDPSWTAPSAGDSIEITRLFPILEQVLSDETSYRILANRALGRMMLSVPVTIAISTLDRYNMNAYPSLTRAEQFREVREPSPITGRFNIHSDRGWRILPGTPVYLQTDRPFLTASGSLEVEWTRQASTWIAVGGTYAESTYGLVSATDEAIPSVEDWLPFALDEALTVLIARSQGRPQATWLALLQQAQADIARSPYRDPNAPQAPAVPGQAVA